MNSRLAVAPIIIVEYARFAARSWESGQRTFSFMIIAIVVDTSLEALR